jgi:hypothetical protein
LHVQLGRREQSEIEKTERAKKRQVTFGKKRSHKVPSPEQRDMGWRS